MENNKCLFARRKQRIRIKLKKINKKRPRLSVLRSNRHVYAQIIDDIQGTTLASASTLEKELRKKVKIGASKDGAAKVGQLIAERAEKKGIKDVVFDRGGYAYHGQVKILADAARTNGLNF